MKNDDDYESLIFFIGKKIKDERIKSGLTQEELASRSGVSRSSFSNLESGHQAPSIFSLFQLSKALDLKFKDIFINSRL